MRGQPAGVGDVFAGFQRAFSQLFLGNFVIAFLVGLCFVPFNIVLLTKLQPFSGQLQQLSQGMNGGGHPDLSWLWPALVSTMPVLLLCMIPATYLTVCWQFTLPLIIDKQMDFWDAMKIGFKRINKRWLHVFGFTVVIGLINLAGFCVCCIGVIFTFPLTIAMTICVYEIIFGESQAS
jgi:hypothetical protein